MQIKEVSILRFFAISAQNYVLTQLRLLKLPEQGGHDIRKKIQQYGPSGVHF